MTGIARNRSEFFGGSPGFFDCKNVDLGQNCSKTTKNACTFEANVVWTLLKDRKVIEEGFTTAAAACPDRSAWKVSLPELKPGEYVFEAKEFSAEDGSLFALDDKKFVIK